jgi:aquaporin Z
MRIAVAEAVGTAVLIIGGVGTAVLSGGQVGQLGIAVAFGLSLFAMVYTVGHVSGCHVNPAVTLAAWAARRVEGDKVPYYVVGQLVGGVVGALVVLMVASGKSGFSAAKGGFASNGYGVHSPNGYNLGAVAVVEIVCTAIFVLIILAATRKGATSTIAGVVIGLALTLAHLISIPVSNTSVNPARSFATALVQHGWALQQLWAFIVFPIIGGVLGALIWLAVDPDEFKTWEGAAEPAPSGG